MGNAWQTQGNPQHIHDPLPALEEAEREITRNPLHVKVVFERLSSAPNVATCADNGGNEGDRQTPDPKDENDSTAENHPARENDFIQESNQTQDSKGTHDRQSSQDKESTQDSGAAQGSEPSQDDETEEDTTSPQTSGGAEQIMHVAVQIPSEFHQLLSSGKDHSHVIVVADRSGSMAGNPWKQVQGALGDMVSATLDRSDIVLDIVVYNTKASEVHFTAQDYKSVLTSLVALGATSFHAAMDKVDEVMKKRQGEAFTSTAIMFLTDGQDTCVPDKVPQRVEKWRTTLRSFNHEVTVHAVGFSRGHDFQFLQGLCEVGTRAGLFRYCEPDDGPETLKLKVQELFDYSVYNATQKLDVNVEMDGKNRILGTCELLKTHTVEGEIIRSNQEGSDVDGTREITVQTEMWVWVPNVSELPSPVVNLSKTVVQNGVHHTFKLPCVCVGVEEKVLEDAASKASWELSILSRNTEVLATQIADAIRDKKDVTTLQKRLTRIQSRLSNTKVFGKGITADLRASLLASMKDIQAKMDTMHGMLARYSRGETASVSILARAHDLRYQAQFKKSRRQRIMDKRAVQNVRSAKVDEAKLDDLEVDEADIAHLSQEAVEFFFCALSQESVVDILKDLANKENAIGFGMAVCRPEYTVDSPTSLQLCLVSGTLVSRSSMLDALEYKVNLAGHLQAHNGFNFFHGRQQRSGGDLGYATVGMGREPINAWLPLYVCRSHWQRVKVILKPSLGYLCTLDPLGFDWAQLDVPFAILGAMIGQLNQATTGTHQLRLLFTFLRTCVACVEEFNLTNRILNIVRTFLREPQGRFKNVLPNLYTLIGYIAALPVGQSRKILGYEEEGRSPDQFPTALWYAFLAETLRRVGGNQFKASSDRQRNMLVDLVLHGRKNSLMVPNKAQEASCSATQTFNNAAGKVQEASCSATATAATASTPEGNTSASAAAATESAASSPSGATTAPVTEDLQHLAGLSQQASAHFTVLCGSMVAQDAELTVLDEEGEEEAESKGEKSAEAVKPAEEFPHCPKMDSNMEVWARSKLSGLENRSQEKKVSSATKQVALWLKQGRQAAGLPDDDTSDDIDKEEEAFDCDTIDSSILEVTSKLLTQLSKGSGVPLSCVPGAVAFLHAWMSRERNLEQMSDGLPPSEWIEEVKVAVDRIYCDMHDYVAQCRQQVANDSLEEVVVVERETEVDSASGTHRRRRRGKGRAGEGRYEDDNESSDDDEDYDEDYAHLEEDDPMKVLKRRQQEHRSLVTLPMILHALDPSENQVKVTRAMLCQAVVNGSNTSAKEAVNEGQFLDLKDKGAAEALMTKVHRHVVRVCTTDQTDSILWRRANVSLLAATNIWAFLGYLMNTYTERSEGFSWLLAEIVDLSEGSKVPCLADKVGVMLTGRWRDHHVLARGNSCMPGRPTCKKLEKVLGEEAWGQIDLDLRSDLSIHVYRESDIPNRHGHCNSNPYIPPALRLRLGLPPKGSSK